MADSYSPMGAMRVASDGSVGFAIPAGTNATPPAANRFQWVRADGTPVADIFGWDGGAAFGERLSIAAIDQAGTRGATNTLQVNRGGNTTKLEIRDDIAGPLIQISTPAKAAQLLDDAGYSTFLKLAALGDRRLDFGTVTMPFGGTASAGPIDIAHGLGAIPAAVVALPIAAAVFGIAQAIWDQAASTAATFRLRAAANAFLGNLPFAWIAIG